MTPVYIRKINVASQILEFGCFKSFLRRYDYDGQQLNTWIFFTTFFFFNFHSYFSHTFSIKKCKIKMKLFPNKLETK